MNVFELATERFGIVQGPDGTAEKEPDPSPAPKQDPVPVARLSSSSSALVGNGGAAEMTGPVLSGDEAVTNAEPGPEDLEYIRTTTRENLHSATPLRPRRSEVIEARIEAWGCDECDRLQVWRNGTVTCHVAYAKFHWFVEPGAECLRKDRAA